MPIENEDLQSQTEPEAPEGEEPDQKATVEQTDEGTSVRLPPPKTRKERRAERDPIRTRDAEIERLRQDLAEQRNMVARIEGHLSARTERPTQQQAPQDPFRSELSSIRREQESISAALRTGNVTEADAARYRDRFYELEDKKEDLRAEQIMARVAPRIPRQADPNESILRAEFPEVYGDQRVLQAAYAAYQNMRHFEFKPESIATARAAMTLAAERFRLRAPALPKATPAQQARYGAIPAQAGAKGGMTEVRLSPAQERMARAMYPNKSEDEAFVEWVRNVGSKLNED